MFNQAIDLIAVIFILIIPSIFVLINEITKKDK
jgi:hypothetical protein